ncbi:hypothetical protein V2J09_004969 [Rumex salicifolius]
MLRKRSRTVTSNKQTIVSDHSSNNNNTNINSSSSEKSQKPTSFLFNSPRIFKDFLLSKDNSSTLMSPSSVLESKPLFSSVFPTCPPQWLDPQNLPSAKHSWEQQHPGIGLALIDHDEDDGDDDEWVPMNKPCKEKRSKLVVFGSQLKIQIPPLPLPNQPPQIPLFPPPTSSPQSPMEFGIKTPKSNLLGQLFVNSFQPEKRSLSVEDMELSEDYTCVISHGPNPKTTHIFGNCIVEAAENSYTRIRDSPASEELDFLSFCHHCKKKIGQGKDIYMYRGERAFCSQECRCQEMLFDGIES